ncbi:13448_t:CDS:2, partial [Dentiscutata erythropus]
MSKNIAQQIILTNPVPNNEEDFFRRANTLFRATRVTMDIMEKSKSEKTNHYSQRTQKINNVQTEQPQKGKCYLCGQTGHFARECLKRKGKEAYNRVQSTYKNYNGRQKKTFVRKYCLYCGKDNRYHTKTCPNNNANYYEGKRARGPTPMIHKYNNFKNNREKGRLRYNNNNRNNSGRRPQNNTRKSFTRRRVNNYKEEKQPKKERSHSQHTNSDKITQLDTANQPKIHLTKSKSHAANYLARKTSDLGKSKKNLPLAPNMDTKKYFTNKPTTKFEKELAATHKFVAPNMVKNKLTTYTLNKTSRTFNNQLHFNNNMILEKAIEPNIITNNVTPQSKNKTILSPIQKGNNNTLKKKKAKPPLERKSKQEFLKENIKQNGEVEETLNKVLPSKKGKKKEDELPKDQLRKMGQIIKQKLNKLDKAILDGEIAKDTKIEQTIQDLNWRLEQINKIYTAVAALITTQARCKDKPTKQALYEKHKEFLESQLEKVGEMHDDKEIQEKIYGDVIKARKKEKPQMLLPDPKGRSTYKPYEQYDVPRDKKFVRENKQIGIRILHSPTDNVFLNERLSQASIKNEDIPQGVLPKVTKFFEDVEQGIKNKFTSRPTTPLPLSQHTLSRTPTIEISADAPDRKRNERGYTPSPDSYERKQQRYKSPSLSSKHTDQISNEEIEIPYYDNVHNKGQSSTYRTVHEVENQLKENKKGYGINDDEEYNYILLNNLTIRQKRKIVPTIIKTEKEKIFSKKETVIPPITLM